MRHSIASLAVVVATTFASSAAWAQSAGPDEAVQPNGVVMQTVALTAGQRKAIYNAVIQHPAKPRADQLSATVGAPVPPFVLLLDLPAEANASNPAAAVLKYAMVENDVVVVDPVAMRVVDVIRTGAKR